MTEKYGFIYIWRDRKHKRYYVGSHWGTKDDGYICSSRWMRKAYNRRPEDFKRRIVKVVHDRRELLREEFRWLSMMKLSEIKGPRYYNINIADQGPGHWSTSNESRTSVGDKISKRLTGRKNGPPSQETRDRIGAAQKGKPRPKHSEETKAKMSASRTGKKMPPRTAEHRKNLGEARRGKPSHRWTEEEKAMLSAKQKGRAKRPESIAKMRATKLADRDKLRERHWARDPVKREEVSRKISEALTNV